MNSQGIIQNNKGTPVSRIFDDIYFSVCDAVGESTFNFIDGCAVKQKISQCNTGDTLSIGETGFGTGLNFVLTIDAFLSNSGQSNVLHYYTVEKHPLTNPQIKSALQGVFINKNHDVINSIVSALSDKIMQGWYHAELYSGRVYLHMYYGDVMDFVDDIKQGTILDNSLDCIYLDGFSPSKNPDMWTDDVLNTLYKKCKVGGNFATFTAVSAVRRILQNVGFTVQKTKGFGHKRERLIGTK